jgi:hypothetical protein
MCLTIRGSGVRGPCVWTHVLTAQWLEPVGLLIGSPRGSNNLLLLLLAACPPPSLCPAAASVQRQRRRTDGGHERLRAGAAAVRPRAEARHARVPVAIKSRFPSAHE